MSSNYSMLDDSNYKIKPEIKEILIDMTKNNSKKTIHSNLATWVESENINIENEINKKIRLEHSLFNTVIGFRNIIICANPEEKLNLGLETPEKYLLLHNMASLEYIPELRRNGQKKDVNEKFNNYKIGTILNAQTAHILSTNKELQQLPVYSTWMTNAGKGFYEQMGIKAEDLIFKGISFKEYLEKSLETAYKIGYKV